MTKEMKGVEFLQHFQREESGSFSFFLRCSLVIKMTWGGNTLGQTLTMEDEYLKQYSPTVCKVPQEGVGNP